MQTDIDKLLHVHLDGELASLLIKVNRTHQQYVVYKRNKPVIYTELDKGLYGMLQAALLFWQNLHGFLVNTIGFTPNPYDHCVVNKEIDGKQYTIGWHIDDIKISHQNPQTVDNILAQLN